MPLSFDLLKKVVPLVDAATQGHLDANTTTLFNELHEIYQESNRSLLSKWDDSRWKEFLNGVLVTLYLSRYEQILHNLETIEDHLMASLPESTEALPPSAWMHNFVDVLEMEHFDQRLELILEDIEGLLSKEAPFTEMGYSLYEQVMGFEY